MSLFIKPLILAGLLLAACAASAQQAVYESEPNNTPAEANRIAGEVAVFGTMVDGDQDGFMWTVSDDDARRRWTFELQGIPGALTIAEIVRVEFADDGVDVVGYDKLMTMGTRDGLTPSIHHDQLFEPGEYLIGIAYAGGPKAGGRGMLRPPVDSLTFGHDGAPETVGSEPATGTSTEPGAYRFIITEGSKLRVSNNPGPRESREQAQASRLASEYATFEPRESTWYRFTFDEKAATQRWDIEARAPIGRDMRARLVDADGGELASRRADAHGLVRFADLAPAATTWYLELTAPDPGFIHVVGSQLAGQRVAGEEAEPNDATNLANRVDFSVPVTGRIGGDDRQDWFVFELDEDGADQLHVLRIESTPPLELQLCLHDVHWTSLQCRSGITPLELPDLLLAPGPWGALIGRAKTETRYSLSLAAQGPVEPGNEVEPNDKIENASAVPSNLRIKGRFTGNDTDFFKFLVPDQPQLWRFQVIGDEIHEVGYYDGSGKQKASLRAKPGQRRVRLDDLYLLPGAHYLRVSGRDGGQYALLARALGPPDPNGEIEPNDQHNMQRLGFGQTRTGLLAEENDSDYYRFFLANWDHIRLTVSPPPDGIVHPYLYWYGSGLGDGQPGGAGEPMVVEGLFPPGDYQVVLSPRQVSDAEYMLSLERLPRFSCPADCEPNGMRDIYLAAALPPDLVLEGKSGEWRDWDYYQLPAFELPTDIVLRSAEPVREVALGTHFRRRERLQYDAELGGYRTTVPAGEPHRLMLDSRQLPYRLELKFPDGPISAVTEALPADLAMRFETDEVSAFRLHGQRVAGELKVSNTGGSALDAALEAVTSDYRWKVILDQEVVSVPAGDSATVAIAVQVPADAWADHPVRISARAHDASGRQAEVWQELSVGREAATVAPELYWPMPKVLLGGLNAAWIPFGGAWAGETSDRVRGDTLRDGLVFPGARIECCGDNDGWSEEERPTWTLQLPGDEPLPVAGVAINHFGASGPYFNIREATLLLSMDGLDFKEALRFETLPVQTEQHFALDLPLLARFAQLRIESTFQEPSSRKVNAAEWKIILEPGFDLSGGEGFDIADPGVGGHLVWDWPPEFYSPSGILTDRDRAKAAGMRRGSTKDYVIGFHQNRAAQITRIEWLYPEALEARSKNFERVDVTISLESPVGPWLPLGEMDLSGAKTTATLALPEHTWARFVRLTAHKHPDAQTSHEPGLVRIWERPTDADYLSVLTEWGDIGPRAFYEWQAGMQRETHLVASGHDSRAAAAPLEVGKVARGQVSLGRKLEHWYRLSVPAGHNTLTIDLSGDPTLRTVLAVEHSSGEAVPLRRIDKGRSPGRHRFEAIVEPESELWLHIAEPPRNVIFAWDTSASVNAYIPQIHNALVAFSGQVVPGRESVNLMPFAMLPLLDDWYGEPYVLQTILNDYRRAGASSSAEWTLKVAAQELAPLPGAKAIVVITDAETTPDGEMWGPMQEVQPRIFGIGVAGSKMAEQHNFRDWATINGGHYSQLVYDGEMEVAFDRAATLMQRPADYELLVGSGFREAPGPGMLTVVLDEGAGSAGGAAVQLIMDASGSMLQRMEGKRRIAVAKEVLTEAVQRHIPAGTPVALRVFGHKEADSCRTDLEIPLGPLDPDAAAARIAGIQAMNLARTPIADSLAAVESDLKGAEAGAAIVLVTDGEETCEGDPGKVIEALQEKGLQVSLNIVGFAIDDAALARQFDSWAELGGGRYFQANDQAGLSAALEEALRLSFTVHDQGGNEVATGQVGGAPVELDQGFYRVVVNTAPPRTFENVEVQGEDQVVLALE